MSGVYLSKTGKNFELKFDRSMNSHVVSLKVYSEIDGISCNMCHGPIKDKIYFCETDNTFMHKLCCKEGHFPKTTHKNPEHSDYLVRVSIEVIDGKS